MRFLTWGHPGLDSHSTEDPHISKKLVSRPRTQSPRGSSLFHKMVPCSHAPYTHPLLSLAWFLDFQQYPTHCEGYVNSGYPMSLRQ